uniref:Uncharacterized protein n=1 Tax=Triticum urartu TaxID=4572 RepID=A0A8R7REM4_TRIUA
RRKRERRKSHPPVLPRRTLGLLLPLPRPIGPWPGPPTPTTEEGNKLDIQSSRPSLDPGRTSMCWRALPAATKVAQQATVMRRQDTIDTDPLRLRRQGPTVPDPTSKE